MSDYAAKKKLPFLDMNLLEKELNMDWDRDSRDEGGSSEYLWGGKG